MICLRQSSLGIVPEDVRVACTCNTLGRSLRECSHEKDDPALRLEKLSAEREGYSVAKHPELTVVAFLTLSALRTYVTVATARVALLRVATISSCAAAALAALAAAAAITTSHALRTVSGNVALGRHTCSTLGLRTCRRRRWGRRRRRRQLGEQLEVQDSLGSSVLAFGSCSMLAWPWMGQSRPMCPGWPPGKN